MRETSCQRNDHQNSSQIICFRDVGGTRKQASGYRQRSHSIFAEYLLHCGPGTTISISKRQHLDFGVNSPGKYSLISSVDFAISSLTLCLSKALVGSLYAFFRLDALLSAILALQLLCAARAICNRTFGPRSCRDIQELFCFAFGYRYSCICTTTIRKKLN